MAAIRITRQSVEVAQPGVYAGTKVRITRQSVEVAQPGVYAGTKVRITRQSVEVAMIQHANTGNFFLLFP